MKAITKNIIATALVTSVGLCWAQVPAELVERIKAIGPIVNPAATVPLYSARTLEKEPYMETQIERDLAYGPDERHLLDVVRASATGGAAKPVLVFVHGGAFVGGNRRTGPGSPFYDNVMLWAVRNGMVGVNMTYRLAPKDPWPAGAQDIGRALAWVQTHIAQRGGDPARVYLFGHSAGASHAAAYLAKPEFHQVPGFGVAGGLLLSGVYNITPELVAASPTYPRYFGSDAATYPEKSSLEGLLATQVPLWIGSAELDPPSFKEQGQLLRERLKNAGKAFGSAEFAAHSHMSEAYSIHSDDRSVGDAMLAFIQKK